MLDFLIDIDTQLFLFLNSLHIPYFDCFMKAFSGKFIWVPMYATILYILFRLYQWKVATCFTIAICLVILCTDQLCASIIRPIFERLRPANIDNPISSLVHIVDGYRGGKYGFPSCHAANSFALAAFLVPLFAKRRFTIFILTWATLNAYSRIYLGVHYPGDLIVGGIIGACIGLIWYFIAKKVTKRFTSSCDNDQQQSKAQQPICKCYTAFHLSDIMIATGVLTTILIGIYSFFA